MTPVALFADGAAIPDNNPYDWHIERIRPQVTEAALEVQPWVKSTEPFLYPLDAEHRVDATVFSLRDPQTRLDVVWQQDAEERPCPYLIRVAGTHSRWTIGGRIALGMTWTAVEKLTSSAQALKRIPVGFDPEESLPGEAYEMVFSDFTKCLPKQASPHDPSEQFSQVRLIFRVRELAKRYNHPPAREDLFLNEILLYCPKQTLSPKVAPFTSPNTIRPNESVGKIRETTSLANLKNMFGEENLDQGGKAHIMEDVFTSATLLYKDDPLRRLLIVWQDGTRFEKIGFVGLDDASESLWHTEAGLSVGTPLTVVERMNRKPFQIIGLQTDDHAYVQSFFKGELDSLTVRFSDQWYAGTAIEDKDSDIYSEKLIPSSNSNLRNLNPRVGTIYVNFGEPSR